VIFGPETDETAGDWRKLHNEKLHTMYSSPSIIRMIKSRRMGWRDHAAGTKKRNVYRILVEKPDGKRPRGRFRRRWKDNNKMDLRHKGWGGTTDWIDLAEDRDQWRALVNTVMNLRIP
jgi:hypothetical protein